MYGQPNQWDLECDRQTHNPKVVSSHLPPQPIEEVLGRNPGFRPFLFLGKKFNVGSEHPRAHVPKGGTWGTRLILSMPEESRLIVVELYQDRTSVNHNGLPSSESFLHQEQIGLRDLGRFADSANRETVAHGLV